MQIDIKQVDSNGIVHGLLYTDERCVKFIMQQQDYEDLIRDGFFIRNGKQLDSANRLNTTRNYLPEK